jgi:flagellar biogenesis protein FliO
MSKLINNKTLILITLIFFKSAFAEDVKIKGIDFSKADQKGIIKVNLSGNLNDNPELKVLGKSIELIIPNAHVNQKISKKLSELSIVASQADRSSVKIQAQLGQNLTGLESLVSVTLKDSAVEIIYPSKGKAVSNISRAPGVKEVARDSVLNTNSEIEKLDESYLAKLEAQNDKAESDKKVAKIEEKKPSEKVDGVKLSQAAVTKSTSPVKMTDEEKPKSTFSVAGYIGKFVAFLSLMILGFYGVLTMFKKGFIKKGKLGFLHSTKMVEVLSTTHIAPKRTLMMVKAHKQVFLISNTESGVQLISEINDITGIIKTGEAEVTGSNFDTNLNDANNTEKEFKLKEDDYADYDSLDEMLNEPPVKDQVRFSDQIKKKVKNLKQLT